MTTKSCEHCVLVRAFFSAAVVVMRPVDRVKELSSLQTLYWMQQNPASWRMQVV